MDTQKNSKPNDLNITFSEVHSDEPHEAVDAGTITRDEHVIPKSHLANKTGVFNVAKAFSEEGKEDGTIVSEKRIRHVPLSESLQNAFSEWFGKTKENLHEIQEKVVEATEEKEPVPTIAKAETRKEIIEKAATHAHIAPTNDSKVVIEKIRTYTSDIQKITGKPTIKPEAPLNPTWSHDATTTEVAPPKPKITETVEAKAVIPDVQKSIVAPVVTQKSNVTIPDFSSAPASTPKPTSLKRVTVESSRPVPKEEKKSPDVAPVITAHTQKSLTDFISHKEVTPTKKEPVLSFIKKETPVTPISKSGFEDVSHIAKPEDTITSSSTRPIPTPEKVPTSIPQPTKLPLKDIESVTPSDAIPEFRSAPIPNNVKRDLDTIRSREEATVPHESTTQTTKLWAGTVTHYALRASILLLIVVTAGALAFYVKSNIQTNAPVEDVTPVETVLPVSAIADTEHISVTALEGTSELFRTSLHEQVLSAPAGLTEIHATLRSSNVSHKATAVDILTFLDAHVSPTTLKALQSDIIIGSITTSKNEPFIVLKSHSFDALFSGMLAWEKNMQSDFTPLFGAVSTSTPIFEDAVRNNVPARIQYDYARNEVLVYSFISDDTVIITSSSRALELLVPHF